MAYTRRGTRGYLSGFGTPTFTNGMVMSGGQFLIPDGSLAAPAIAFSNDTDTGFARVSTLLQAVFGGASRMNFAGTNTSSSPLKCTSYIELAEMTEPAAPATDNVRLYAVDDTAKTELRSRFPTGAVQQVTQEP
jgi:hypothetical protein